MGARLPRILIIEMGRVRPIDQKCMILNRKRSMIDALFLRC